MMHARRDRPTGKADKPLNVREARFVLEYQRQGFSGTKAALAAGYSAKTACSIANQLLKRAHVRAAIDAQSSKIAKKLDVTLERLTEMTLDAYEKAKGKAGDKKNPPIPANPSAMVKAVAQLSRMHGFDAPKEIEMRHSGQIAVVPDAAAERILRATGIDVRKPIEETRH